MSTQKNMASAFAGESQANRKYLAFAKKADDEGYPQVARTFRAAAAAETIHAHNHFRNMGGVNDTAKNLEVAIEGENYEFTKMYPEFIKEAEKENAGTALNSFKQANEVEKIHHELYNEALETIKNGKDLEEGKMFVCPVCGHTVKGEAPESCPICHVPGDKYMEIE